MLDITNATKPTIEHARIAHWFVATEYPTISPYIIISNIPIKLIRLVSTFVKNFSFKYEPKTRKDTKIAHKRKGNGTGDPGEGTHAVLASLISYPSAHSNLIGTQPSPSKFTWNPSGHTSPM